MKVIKNGNDYVVMKDGQMLKTFKEKKLADKFAGIKTEVKKVSKK